MFNPIRPPFVVEARRKARHHSDRSIRRTQQKRPGIRSDRPAVEGRDYLAAFNGCKSK
jgi:hypothetical protein